LRILAGKGRERGEPLRVRPHQLSDHIVAVLGLDDGHCGVGLSLNSRVRQGQHLYVDARLIDLWKPVSCEVADALCESAGEFGGEDQAFARSRSPVS
jgi:hypothetical protein